MNDLVGGHVDFFCEQAVSVAPQITAGTIKAYAMSGSERLAALPDVPTAKEAGRQLSDEHLGRHLRTEGHAEGDRRQARRALDKALDDPGVKKRIADLGGSLPAKDERKPAKFDAFVKAEIARWSPILKATSTNTN